MPHRSRRSPAHDLLIFLLRVGLLLLLAVTLGRLAGVLPGCWFRTAPDGLGGMRPGQPLDDERLFPLISVGQ